MSQDESNVSSTIELATELTIAWLANPNTRATKEDVPEFLKSMHDAVANLAGAATSSAAGNGTEAAATYEPAVSIRKSLASKDHIISMIDGKPYRTLRRHLSTHGLSPAEYRERYGLKPDYPMVAPAYSEQRRAMAKKIGLGRKAGMTRGAEPAGAAQSAGNAEAKRPRGRRKTAETATA